MTRACTPRDYEVAIASMQKPRIRAAFEYYGPDAKGEPRKPHPRQQEFLKLSCLEALYGGGAGGGKSDALLMAALEYVNIPNYSALILRRTFADLKKSDAIMARADEWLRGTDARWDADIRTWHFPSGAKLEFGYFDHANQKMIYQGGAWQFIGWDELTQFPEDWYTYMFSRLRKTSQAVPLRVRATTNPGGIGHQWVYERFIEPWEKSREEKGREPVGEETKRPFVQSLAKDNPSLDQAAYEASLAELSEADRRQLRDGIWEQSSGVLVYSWDKARNTARHVPKLAHWALGIDYGNVNACAFVEIGWAKHDRRVFITKVFKKAGMGPTDAAEYIDSLMAQRDYDFMVGDVGGLGKGYAEESRTRWKQPIRTAKKVDKLGYIGLFNGALERSEILVCEGCELITDEWKKLPWNKDHTGEMKGFENHASDAALYVWRDARAWREKPLAEKPYETLEARIRRDEEEEARKLRPARGNGWAKAMMNRGR